MTSALLETLLSTYRLPEAWSELEVVEDVVVADGVQLHRAGVASKGPSGEEVTGSAAQPSSSPLARSYYELLERAATLDAIATRRRSYELRAHDGSAAGACSADALFPESDDCERWRYARSNGIAVHQDWSSAASRAFWELAERDRILRSWYGDIAPERLAWDISTTVLAGSEKYDWSAHQFVENDSTRFSSRVNVVGVFGFPKDPDAPLVFGFGARFDVARALEHARDEALQLLAFLWGEPVTESAPRLGPTPMHHLEHFQFAGHHRLLRGWLKGAHMSFGLHAGYADATASQLSFVDLTPSWLSGGLRVVKAFCPSATPLSFGASPFAAHLPDELRAHPIA